MVEEQVLAHTQVLKSAHLQVEVVQDLNRFNAIAPECDRLVDRSGVDRVFVSHAWFRTWWEAFGAGNDLHIVTVRSGGQLVAAAPMMRTREGVYGIKAQTLQSIYNPHRPRYDFIVGLKQDILQYIANSYGEKMDSEISGGDADLAKIIDSLGEGEAEV